MESRKFLLDQQLETNANDFRFGCLQDSEYHPWIKSFFNMARSGSYLYAATWWPFAQKALMLMTPPKVWLEQIQLYTQSVKKLKTRMEFEGTRPDLIQCLLDNKEKLVRGYNLA